ncbi:MAG: diguanylate cyclase [Rhizobacter sp.]
MDPLVLSLSDSVAAARSLEDLTRPLLEMLEAVTGLESTYLTRIDETQGVQHVLYVRNTRGLNIPEGLSVPWGDTLCKRALDENRPYTADVPAVWGDSDAAKALGIQTYVSSPVRMDDGSLYGTLCAAGQTQRPLPENAEKVLQLFARLIAQQVEREELLQRLATANAELAERASKDMLTGLPNRRLLMDEMARLWARCLRDKRHVMLCFIDLDGFKTINDTHGHRAGDELLVQVADRLQRAMRAGDMLARLGGDEFVIVGTGPSLTLDGRAVMAVLEGRFTLATTGNYLLAGKALPYRGASVGGLAIDPAHASPEDAMHAADARMYEIKRQRRAGR